MGLTEKKSNAFVSNKNHNIKSLLFFFIIIIDYCFIFYIFLYRKFYSHVQ